MKATPHPCHAPRCHSGIAGHHCPTPIERAERHDPAICPECRRLTEKHILGPVPQGAAS